MRLYFNGWMKRFVPCCSKKVGTEIRNIFFSTCQSRAPYSFFLLFWLEGTCLLAVWFPVRIMSKTFPPKMRPPYPLNKCVIGCSAICVCFQPLLCFLFLFLFNFDECFWHLLVCVSLSTWESCPSGGLQNKTAVFVPVAVEVVVHLGRLAFMRFVKAWYGVPLGGRPTPI